jgi:hypothetical protein
MTDRDVTEDSPNLAEILFDEGPLFMTAKRGNEFATRASLLGKVGVKRWVNLCGVSNDEETAVFASHYEIDGFAKPSLCLEQLIDFQWQQWVAQPYGRARFVERKSLYGWKLCRELLGVPSSRSANACWNCDPRKP